MITAFAEDTEPLIWNEGGGQFILACCQHDVVDAPPTVKLIGPDPRPVITPTVQEEPHPSRWVALSRHQASWPGDRKSNLYLPVEHQWMTQGGRYVMYAILGWKVETPTAASCCRLGGHPRRVALATNDGPDLPSSRIE